MSSLPKQAVQGAKDESDDEPPVKMAKVTTHHKPFGGKSILKQKKKI